MEEANTQLAELFDRATLLGKVETIDLKSTATPLAVLSVPKGRDLKSLKPFLDEYLERPERRVGTANLQDLDSFVDWVNRHKDAASVLRCFVNPTNPSLNAIIDYHEAGPGELKSIDGKARWAKFQATYALPLSKQWKEWTAISGKPMGQAAFAAFLEDHILDLVGARNNQDGEGNLVSTLPAEVARFLALNGGKCAEPDEVVQLSKGLDLYADTKVAERVNLQSGETSFTFEEKHRGAPDQVVVPQIFLVALPVFELAATLYRVPVRLRYRLHEGKLLWIPTLWQAEEVFDKAVRDAAADAKARTDLPLFYGTAL